MMLILERLNHVEQRISFKIRKRKSVCKSYLGRVGVIGLSTLLALLSYSQFIRNNRLIRQLFHDDRVQYTSIRPHTSGLDEETNGTTNFSSFSTNNLSNSDGTASNERTSRRFLIIQYSGVSNARNGSREVNTTTENILLDFYETLLSLTSKANQAYAIKWKLDYMLFRGIPFLGRHYNESCGFELFQIVRNGVRLGESNLQSTSRSLQRRDDSSPDFACSYNFSQSRATYNKIIVLQILLHDEAFKDKYDRVLLMDSDAMMYDFSRDITLSYLPEPETGKVMTENDFRHRSDYVFVAHKTNKTDDNNTGSVNIGVTLWNLRHPVTPFIVQKWQQRSIFRLRKDNKTDDDQNPLQYILKELIPPDRRVRVIRGVSNEFGYGRGTMIRHFIRPDFSNWITQNTTAKSSEQLNMERLLKVQNALNEVCTINKPICDY